MTVHIVGLGPGKAELMTSQTERLLFGASKVILRTEHHPAVQELHQKLSFETCDDLYRDSEDFGAAYAAIVDRVMAAARNSDVVYAVPGSPTNAESSVVGLVAAAREAEINVLVHPALSYADAASAILAEDFARVQLCDALDLRIDAQRPALVGQVYDRDTAGELKLALLDVYPADHAVFQLRDLGTNTADVTEIPLKELDHRPFSYRDAVFIPAIPASDDVRRFDGLHHIIARLHAPGGCPWDREQTHASLRHYLLEESYECLEAIDQGDPAMLAEELGDVLLQVLMHAEVAEREEEFGLAEIIERISRKLIHRHPHVFGNTVVGSPEEVSSNWDNIKRAEKPDSSIVEGVPASLPALASSQALQSRARRSGFDWPDIEGPLDKLVEEVGEFARAGGTDDREGEFGDVLFVVVNIADRLEIDAEQALRGANSRFRERFMLVEKKAREKGLDLHELDLAGLDALWDEAKLELRGG